MSHDHHDGARPGADDVGGGSSRQCALLRRAIDGDRFALGELWDEWNPALVRFLRSVRVVDAEDVASDVWVDLARRMPEIGPDPEAFRRILFTIGRRRAVDARRYRWRRPEQITDPQSYREPASTGPGVADRVSDELLAQSLLAKLERAQAEVVALRVIGGFSAAETAALTGRSEGAVRIMAMRALRQLREFAVAAGVGEVETSVPAPGQEIPSVSDVTDRGAATMVQP
jgi:RNA polymerase sigma-70 factor (ECF subfamily)